MSQHDHDLTLPHHPVEAMKDNWSTEAGQRRGAFSVDDLKQILEPLARGREFQAMATRAAARSL
jgi:hypothetical protein